jgi:hypothetical protein
VSHEPSRPDEVDVEDVRHRHGCSLPGFDSQPSTVLRDVVVRRCLACGAVKLDRAQTPTTDTDPRSTT